MRGTLVFVHGTGVRQAGWTTLWGRVQDYARMGGITGVRFVGCNWGETLGVKLDLLPATLPPEVSTKSARGGQPPGAGDLETAAWALRLDDPLFELRLAGLEGEAESGQESKVLVGALREDQAAAAAVRELARRASEPDLAGSGIAAGEIERAAGEIAASPELARAALAHGAADGSLLDAVARSVAAQVLSAHREDEPGCAPPALFDGAARATLVAQLRAALPQPATKGLLTDWLWDKAKGFALEKGTRFAADRRLGLLGAASPAAGDILYYQRRGGELLSLLAETLTGLEPPVVAVGHSLGGIMLVDLLSRPLSRAEAPRVDLLVTAGSQAPLLYAYDALEGLRRNQPLPAPFTPWLNLYNRHDFLSYCAGRVFPESSGITDVEVDPGVPFPEAHSAYWYHVPVYERIRDAWPRI